MGNGFGTFDPSDLTFDPVWCVDKVWKIWGQGIRELLIGKRKGYRQTYIYKTICPLFFKGGHN